MVRFRNRYLSFHVQWKDGRVDADLGTSLFLQRSMVVVICFRNRGILGSLTHDHYFQVNPTSWDVYEKKCMSYSVITVLALLLCPYKVLYRLFFFFDYFFSLQASFAWY